MPLCHAVAVTCVTSEFSCVRIAVARVRVSIFASAGSADHGIVEAATHSALISTSSGLPSSHLNRASPAWSPVTVPSDCQAVVRSPARMTGLTPTTPDGQTVQESERR